MSYSLLQADSFLSTRNLQSENNSSSQDGNSSSNGNGFHPRPVLRRKKSGGRASAGRSNSAENFPIIVHCHLCWDWVWQRPQQFLSRLSRNHKILFIETVAPDPQLVVPTARFRVEENFSNITILRIQFPLWCWGDGHYVDNMRRLLVREALAGPLAGQFENPVQWFYDPMAVESFAGFMNERAIVYDCMDELSKFRGAPTEIVLREKELLACADVVFCGGWKLCESKSEFNDNCHFYGCGVDVEHFGKARAAETTVPEDVRSLQKPVLGYFGVVDERMDYELIEALADSNPGWSVVFVGPTAKVDPAALPRRPNLHWLGQRPYAELPAYCKAFDLCLMPFALNEATEFINPTKALEYMATGRMVVSSAVPDVVRNFGAIVRVANSREEFIELCRKTLAKPDEKIIEGGLKMAGRNSWDSIVVKLEEHISEATSQKRAVNGARKSAPARPRNGVRAKVELATIV